MFRIGCERIARVTLGSTRPAAFQRCCLTTETPTSQPSETSRPEAANVSNQTPPPPPTTTTTLTESAVKATAAAVAKSKPVTFAKLFKESKFVALGPLDKKVLVGKIIEVNGNDLYIDYGGKFMCVCKMPERNEAEYTRGVNVVIRLFSFEMASYFLNAARHLTLLESDAELLGLHRPSKDNPNDLFESEVETLNMDPTYY